MRNDSGAELAEELSQHVDVQRYGPFVVDPESGVIYEGLHAWDLDQLIEANLESAEQEKQWKARRVVLGLVLMKRLELEGVSRYTSPGIGQVAIMPGQRRSARTEGLDEVCERFGVDDEARVRILMCASQLSVSELDALLRLRPELAEPIRALITTSGQPFVKVTPALLEATSRVTKETRKRCPK